MEVIDERATWRYGFAGQYFTIWVPVIDGICDSKIEIYRRPLGQLKESILS